MTLRGLSILSASSVLRASSRQYVIRGLQTHERSAPERGPPSEGGQSQRCLRLKREPRSLVEVPLAQRARLVIERILTHLAVRNTACIDHPRARPAPCTSGATPALPITDAIVMVGIPVRRVNGGVACRQILVDPGYLSTGYPDNILRMWCANRSLISRWRGTGWESLVTGFRYQSCFPPCRMNTAPCRSMARIRSRRFTPRSTCHDVGHEESPHPPGPHTG